MSSIDYNVICGIFTDALYGINFIISELLL